MKHVLITGASDGIGLAVARLLAAEKDTRLTLVARNAAKLRETAGGHDYIVADLSRLEGVELVTQQLGATHYDVLINNAGAGLYGRFTELPLDARRERTRLRGIGTHFATVFAAAKSATACPVGPSDSGCLGLAEWLQCSPASRAIRARTSRTTGCNSGSASFQRFTKRP